MTPRERLKSQRDYMRKVRKERLDAGLCTHCGGRVAVKEMRDGTTKKLKMCEAYLIQLAVNKKKKGKL